MFLKKILQFSLILFLGLLTAKSVSAAITIRPALNLGLVGYWSMDEGTGSTVRDQSGNGHTGTYYNIATDNFNRANEDPLASPWETPGNALMLSGNRVVQKVGGQAEYMYYDFAFNEDQYSQVRIGSTAANPGPAVRIRTYGTQTGYFSYLDDDLINTYAFVDGSFYLLKTTTRTHASGTVYRLSAQGEDPVVLRLYADGNLIDTITDSTWLLAGGEPGLHCWSGSGAAMDDWEGGNIGHSPWVDGKIGKALDFDGGVDYVDMGSDSALAPQTFTASAWFKPHNLDQNFVRILQQGPNDGGWGIEWDAAGGDPSAPDEPYGVIWNGGSYQRVVSSATTTINPESWYFVTLSYDDSTNVAKFYIDGQLVGSRSSTIMTEPISYNFNIGRHPSDSNYINAAIDETRLYNRVLSDAEIQRLYNLTRPKLLAPNTIGLVGYWSFDEGLGDKAGDMSGRGNTGTASGSPVWVDGKRGKALSFNGNNNYVDMGDILDSLTTTTISTWVKWNGGDGGIISTDDSTGNYAGYWMEIFENSGNSYVESGYGDDAGSGYPNRTHRNTPDGSIATGTWYNITTVYNGLGNITTYINGSNAGGTMNGGGTSFAHNSSPLKIGVRNIGSANIDNFNGSIDEVRIYDRALSATEVAGLYNSSKKIIKYNTSQNNKLTNGLVGMWSFNGPDLAGSIAIDRSGQNNNATITGATIINGKVGQALSFNGSSNSIDLGNVYNGVKSVTFWVKTADTSDNGYFDGRLDEVRFYSSTLSAADVKRLYNLGASGTALPMSAVQPNTKIIDLNGTAGVKAVSGTITASGFTSPTIYVDGASATTIDDNWRFVTVTTATGINASAATLGLGDVAEWACGDALVDSRDSKSYATVEIGTQCWMKQGLNVGTRVNGATSQGTTCASAADIEKWCYSNTDANCDTNNNPNYPDGGLYQWNQMMCGSTTPGVQGICPTGWHLPTDAEICTLEQAVDATIGCGTTGWRGTDGSTKLKPNGSSGWEGNLAGNYVGVFVDRGTLGYFWSSSVLIDSAWFRELYSGYATVSRDYYNKGGGFSVHCLKD